jgi:hypothetical protein
MVEDDEGLWTAEQVRKFLNVSLQWVYLKAGTGELPSLKIAGVRRFDPTAIRSLKTTGLKPKSKS